jgi:hypothetical protein
MITTVDTIKALITAADQYPQYPFMVRAVDVFVFSKDFIEDEWNEFWKKWKFANDFVYVPGSGMCEEFALEAIAKFLRSNRKRDPKANVTAGAFEIRMSIGSKPVNAVSDGGHATVLLVVINEQQNIELYVWEPQNERWCLLADADCVLHDVFL